MPVTLKDPKFRRFALIAGAALVTAVIAGSVIFQDTLFRMSIKPAGRFDEASAPPAPDYTKPEAWALKPARLPPGGWEKPWGIDIFFIHSISNYGNSGWNNPIDNTEALERLKDRILPNQAGPFLQAGPVYAPLYREASLYSEIDVGAEGSSAFELAYQDVLRAFDVYMTDYNRHRGVVVVGVGQGGLYAERLLSDRFQMDPLKDRLAVAYIIDAILPADFPGKAVAQPLCESPDQIHCIVGWRTAFAGDDTARLRDQSPVWTADWKIATSEGRQLACINPLRWTPGNELSARADHRGGARAKGSDDLEPKIIEHAVSARCNAGLLEVERPSDPQLQPDSGSGAQYKTPEYNLFYADIVPNLTGRMNAATAWLDNVNNTRKPAEPLPPAQTLTEAPIYRPGGEPEAAN